MDYLKAFTIGTSGLVTLPHFAQFVLDKDRHLIGHYKKDFLLHLLFL